MAQEAAGQQGATETLRAEQAQLFRMMAAEPGDLDAMFSYAAISMRLQDYEAAIATLERMLIFEPDLPRVRLELGVAYFRLGSYEVARTYFEDVLATKPPEDVVARVTPFIDAIEDRTARHAFSGFASIGLVFSTNANLGPEDRFFSANIGGVQGIAQLPADATSESDVGARFSAGLRHAYDLGLARDGTWISSVGYYGLRYRDVRAGNIDALRVETGPRLALDARTFGPSARPFVLGGFVRSENEPLYGFGGAGIEYNDTLDENTGVFALATGQYRDYESGRNNFDGFYGALRGGVAWSGIADLTLRATAFFETDRADEGFTSANEVGLRLSAARNFPIGTLTGLETVFAGVATSSAYIQTSGRWFDDADPVIDPDTRRRDWEGRIGARLFTPLQDGWGIVADASLFGRDSNYDQNDVDSFEIGLSLQKSF